MEFQQIFKKAYLESLYKSIIKGKHLEYYTGDVFLIQQDSVLIQPEIIQPPNLTLINTDSNSKGPEDLANAKILYNAYDNLTPLQASDERFWVYLAHCDHFKYMRKRWPRVENGSQKDISEYIIEHWFIGSPSQGNFMRQGISRLWWAAYLSYDEANTENPFHLTEILFRSLDFATRTLGTYNLARHRPAVIGILLFIKKNPELFESNFEAKTRYITKYLNQLGGVKPLAFFSKEYFFDNLQLISEKIKTVANRER